jgi:hypothetical protein
MKGMNFRIFVFMFVVYGFLTSMLSVGQNLVLPDEAKILLDKIEQATKGKIVEINYIKDVFWREDRKPAGHRQICRLIFSSSGNFFHDIKDLDKDNKRTLRHLIYYYDGEALTHFRVEKKVYYQTVPPEEAKERYWWWVVISSVFPPPREYLEELKEYEKKQKLQVETKISLTKTKLGSKNVNLLTISSNSPNPKVLTSENKYWLDIKTNLPIKVEIYKDMWLEVYEIKSVAIKPYTSNDIFVFKPPKDAEETDNSKEVLEYEP